MQDPTLLTRLALADTRFRQALHLLLIWHDPEESRTASQLFMEGVTERAREVLPPGLYTLFEDAAEANAELRRLEQELRQREEAVIPP